MSNTALATTTPATAELYRQATDVAGVCRDIVTRTAQSIQGRKYVKVEGWQSIATAHGCVASARDVERVEGGVRAIGEIRRMSDGVVIATAEGFVGEDEPTWFGGQIGNKTLPKRPDYAIRAMCQTRAISRACRSAFAHVVVLIDSNLSTTPAEEVPSGGFDDNHAAPSKPSADLSDAPRAVTVPDAWQDCEVHFGKNKGKKLGELPEKTLRWYITEWHPKPYNGRISDEDTVLRECLDKAGRSMAMPAQTVPPATKKADPVAAGKAGEDDEIQF